ncbi:GNL3L/Grn1 GTPase [Fomitiporia mediterranea MF3/22]|uniref:GNL3L/Grn1 GTPase n=1 Tax=Fomitiporia mediterranea (strain MF3/22) TaxID=694068 RepID=UPI00044085C6|nr:GNL3L/Grn1 GTPase [Fomitiporia mediterranea MF3/22]EJD00979.1 GNL3L/Grn1 GTPase [Fomitiporia mediterranea MF3/22]
MPRIRKKTSKRRTTHQRARIQHKVKEGKKKSKKEAKKDTQWKSKHRKDPGIPNSFPYKAELLAEIAEQRRQVRGVLFSIDLVVRMTYVSVGICRRKKRNRNERS